MKRCPQCLFIYPESDQHCDFDNTPLVVVNDSEIDAVTRPRRRKLNFRLIAVLVVLQLVGVVVYKISYSSSPEIPAVVTEAAPLPDAPAPTPLPSPSVSPSPTPKPSPTRTTTSHTTSSLNPVSTGGPATGTKRGGKPAILLTDGGKIEADEVWRTRDGIWYRRNGIVTLIKHGRVRSIVNQ
jgi:hypothetical protein